MIYASALLNVSIVGFVWLKRQLKMADKEAKEVEDMKVLTSEMDVGNWTDSNRFRCFFAAQRYHALDTRGPEEEKPAEVQKILEVLAQCRGELYTKLPAETPAMRPLHL